MENIWLLRWRFDYSDDKPARYGLWSRSSRNPIDMAAFVNKENLRRASIEAKNFVNRDDVRILAECDGWDFVNFQWMAEARVSSADSRVTGHRLIGLKLVTRDWFFLVFRDGTMQKVPRPEDDKKFHYAGFGR